MVRTSEPVAHKPLGAGSSVLSSKGFSATAGTAACTDWHRQHERAEVDLFTTSTNAHCPLFFSLSHSPLKGDALTSHWPAARLYAFPTINILPLVLCKTREKGASVILIASNWLDQPWLLDLTAAGGAALANPRQEGSAISGERLGVAPEPRVVEPSCVAASGISEELSALHSRVLDTLSEARAPSTRRLYALKWGVFMNVAVMFISTRLFALCQMFCVFYSTDWIVDLYHQHWKSMWLLFRAARFWIN